MYDVLGGFNPEHCAFSLEHFGFVTPVATEGLRLVQAVIERLTEIDSHITCASKNWSLSRMCRLDRAILRLGVYEILHDHDVPSSVAINEAVELSKSYGSPESSRFINGVLDCVANGGQNVKLGTAG